MAVYVFIDDSGDGGMKLDRGSSRYVVMAACVFETHDALRDAHLAIESVRVRHCDGVVVRRYENEFKYAKTKASLKDQFFEAMRPLDFHIRVIYADKALIRSPKLRSEPDNFKAYLIRQLLTHTFGTVVDAKVIIDGKDRRAFNMTSGHDYLIHMVNQVCPQTLREVEFADSRTNQWIQVSDMVAGAAHGWLRRKPESMNHFEMIRQKTFQPRGSLWNFTGGA